MSNTQERQTLFAETIGEMNRGRLAVEIDEKLMEITKAVQETGNAGELTLKLVIKSSGEGEVTVTDKLTSKVPQKPHPAAIFFVDDNSRLVRDDPKQKVMFKPEELDKKAA